MSYDQHIQQALSEATEELEQAREHVAALEATVRHLMGALDAASSNGHSRDPHQRLVNWMAVNGYTDEEAGNLLGRSQSWVYKARNGYPDVSQESLVRLLDEADA